MNFHPLKSKGWFHGPKFLKNFEISSDPIIPNIDVSEVLEKRKLKVFCINRECWTVFLSLPRLIQVLLYITRFINSCQKRPIKKKYSSYCF